jgi:hypothetical protein
MLIGREHSPLLERISKLELKNIVAFSILFSLIANIGHLFQYQINDGNEFVAYGEGSFEFYTISPMMSIAFASFFAIFKMLYFFCQLLRVSFHKHFCRDCDREKVPARAEGEEA